jgi:MATE family multidrug resistance protein
VVVQLGLMSMGVADTIMVGHVSPVDLAAVALGSLYFWAVSIFGMGVLMALDPVVAQAVGAGDEVAIGRGVQRGGLISAVLALVASLLLLPATPLLIVLRQPPDVVPVAARYCLVSIPGTLPFFLFVVFRQSLQAMGRMRPIVLTILAANVLNLFLNWVLVYGNLGAPAMGAVGSGWASTFSRWFMVLAVLGIAWGLLRPYVAPIRPEVFSVRPLLRMIRLGGPVGIQLQLEFGAFGVIGIMMGWLGTIAMAGHQVAINLASLTFMVPLGVSAASAVLVGHAVGRGDAAGARRAAGSGLALGGTFMVGSAVLLLLFPGLLARVYTSEADVLAVAVALIPVAGVFQVFDGLQVVASGVLRGIGDTRAPMVVNVLGFWLIGMPISVVFGFRLGGGPIGLWWGLASGLAAVALFLLARIRIRFARELTRLTIDEESADGP